MTLVEALEIHRPFLDNKYTNWYLKIVSKESNDTYTETHHIFPKSLFPKYEKCKWNLVKLSARQHFIVHVLLVKMLDSKDEQRKMSWAVQRLKGNKKYFNSRLYEIIRKKLAEVGQSEEQKKKVLMTKLSQNLKLTEETKRKIANSIKGIVRGPMSEEHKQKMIESKKKNWVPKTWMNKDGIQTKVKNEEVNSFLSNGWQKGTNKKHVTEEYKKMLSEKTKEQWQKVKLTGHIGNLIGV
jgi:hypothetical protein